MGIGETEAEADVDEDRGFAVGFGKDVVEDSGLRTLDRYISSQEKAYIFTLLCTHLVSF